MIESLFGAFSKELSEREGSFNSDEIWQAWVADNEESYIKDMSKGNPEKAKASQYVWDRVISVKEEFVDAYAPDHVIASVNLGTKPPCNSTSAPTPST